LVENSKFIHIWAVKNRVYTGETHAGGFENLNFVLVQYLPVSDWE
jgi:hypothetical protein